MKPITRKEKILDAILSGNTDNIPTPITREEAYLKAIAENGGGGGGAESTIAWKPTVDANGNISWTRTSSTTVPATQNIKGNKGNTGDKGDKGETGATGETGPAGPGLASGGVAGSLLFKSSNDDYATEWVDSGIATVEGNPATAETDSAGIGVKTVVDIEPIQDLHGYDAPWVGGAGKNLFNYEQLKNASGWTESNGVYSGSISSLYSYAVNGFPSQPAWKENTRYAFKFKVVSATGNSRFRIMYTDDSYSDFVIAPSKVGDYINNTTDGKTVSKILFTYNSDGDIALSELQIEEGTTYSKWEPYSNVCPISGRSEVAIQRVGKNLVEDKIVGYNIDSIGRISLDANFDMQIAKIRRGETYTITTNDPNLVAGYFDTKPTTTSQSYDHTRVVDTQSKTFIAPIDGYIAFRTSTGYATPQCEFGSTATTYEPYKGKTYTIQFTDGTNPLTVYGGTLDVVSGVLTVDRGFITFDGSEDEIISTDNEGELFMVDYANLGDLVPKKDINGIPTNRISPSATRMGNTAFELYWRGLPSDIRTVEALRTWLTSNNLQVCYELATPYTISLPPHQIKLLQGVNNLSTNAHSISLTYRKGKVVMNSDLEGLADSVNVLADEVDSFGIKPLTATALSDAVTISTFSAMKINKNVIFSCRVVITPTEEGSMPLFTIDGIECPFEHTAKGTNSSRGIEGRWAIAQDTNILTWTVVSTELDKSNDILIQGVLAVK